MPEALTPYPQFTVAMCVYCRDDAANFELAVHSVYSNQTVKPSEIVIVVDGPVPGEIDSAIDRLTQAIPVIKIVRLPCNVGHAGARQTGLEAASHELIAIMDADDLSAPSRFETQLAAFADDIDIIGGQIDEFVGKITNVIGERIVPLCDAEIKTYLKSRSPMNFVTVMYRKSKVMAIGGFIDWFCEEDYYLWVRMAIAGCRFANVPDILVNVRVGSEMYSRRGGWRYFRSEARLQTYMLRKGIISLPRYCYNVGGRFAVQVMMPNSLRGFVFQKLLRK